MLVDEHYRLARERLSRDTACRADPAGDVRKRLPQGERPKLASQRDPLLELSQRRFVQPPGDLGLAGNDERQQLLLAGLDVGEQPNLLEQLVREALGLVDD